MSCRHMCITHNDKICCFECEDYKTCQIKCKCIQKYNLNSNSCTKYEHYIKNEENIKKCSTVKKGVVSKDFTETTYFVKLKERYIQELCKTKVANRFCGTIVNQTVSNIYFELKDTKELVIIPYEYILWLAPVKDK